MHVQFSNSNPMDGNRFSALSIHHPEPPPGVLIGPFSTNLNQWPASQPVASSASVLLRPFVAEFKMNYPVLMGLDQDTLLATYEAEVTVPVTWFIKRDGTVLSRNIGINTRQYFESQIQAILGS